MKLLLIRMKGIPVAAGLHVCKGQVGNERVALLTHNLSVSTIKRSIGLFRFYVVSWYDGERKQTLVASFTAKTLYRKFETNTVFPEMKLCGLVPNTYIQVSVSDLYSPKIGLPILQQNRWTKSVGINKSLTDTWMWKLGTKPRNFMSGNT